MLTRLAAGVHLSLITVVGGMVGLALLCGVAGTVIIKAAASKKPVQITLKTPVISVVKKQGQVITTITSTSSGTGSTHSSSSSTPASPGKTAPTSSAQSTQSTGGQTSQTNNTSGTSNNSSGNDPAPLPSLSQTPLRDSNWTGYELWGSTNQYTMVEGSVVIPTITCPSQTQGSQFSLWVGLDGHGNSTVEQEGMRAMCDHVNCSSYYCPDYYVWTEMYPLGLVKQPLAIAPGDTLSMRVTYIPASAQYELYMKNETSGQTFTSYQSCPAGSTCLRSSAEWITENHLASGTLISLFNQATFTNTYAATSGSPFPFTNVTNYPVEAYYNGQKIESVSYPLSQGATSFTITQL